MAKKVEKNEIKKTSKKSKSENKVKISLKSVAKAIPNPVVLEKTPTKKQVTIEEISAPTQLVPTKKDYWILAFLIFLIIFAISFIIWTRNGYVENFTNSFS